MSDWLAALQQQCTIEGQAVTARRLGVSAALVNKVIQGKYLGNLTRIEALVRGTFLAETVECSILGQISRRRCLDERGRPFAPTNPQRVALFRACRNGCPNKGVK